MAPLEVPEPKLYLVSLGPGATDLLTLRAWELLASGRKVIVSTIEHEVCQTLAARGIAFDVIVDLATGSLKERLIAEVSSADVVYAEPGHILSAPQVAPLLQALDASGIAFEVVPGIDEIEMLPASDVATSTYSAPIALRAGKLFAHLVSVMARLRAPGGCPWDAEQDHQSLAIHLIEETYETLEAIDDQDMSGLEEELGDVLLQVVFHAEIAQEDEHFDIGDVVEELIAKLVARHPHVFGEVAVGSSAEVVQNWESLKKQHKARTSLGEGIPKHLPGLLYAHKVHRRLSGVDRLHPSAAAAARQMLQEPLSEDSLGDVLFEIVGLAQLAGLDPEGALRRTAKGHLESSQERETTGK